MTDNLVLIVRLIESLFSFSNKFVIPFLKDWWWVFPPVFLIGPVANAWLWWRRSLNIKEREYVVLEIKIPVEIVKPLKAMEDVFASCFSLAMDHDPSFWREKWIEGQWTFFPSLSFEIASIDGQTHFYVRTERAYRDGLETAIYAQYPEVQITEVPDYVEAVPQDIPNKNWNFLGKEWYLKNPNPYPLKTYEDFGTETEPKEERKVDPMAHLLEAFSILKQGEQIWLQFIISPPNKNLGLEGAALRDKLAHRSAKLSSNPIVKAIDFILNFILSTFGVLTPKQEEKKPEVFPSEMRLTPGEQQTLRMLEKKASKTAYETTVRFMYLGKREVFYRPRLGLPISFLGSFAVPGYNWFGTYKPTQTKVKGFLWFLDKRLLFLKQRKMFSGYKMRYNPEFPDPGGSSVLNVEELATIFHFPGRIAAPGPNIERLESRKGEPPAGLPIG